MTSETPKVPRVSIVLPTHQRAYVLGRAIRSILAQDVTDWELIVVDDGSTDETQSVVASFNDPRIRYVKLDVNRGAGAARNAGIRHAASPLIAFQDSDDEWVPHRLGTTLAPLTGDPRPRVVHGDLLRVNRDGSTHVIVAPSVRRGVVVDRQRRQYETYGLGITATLIPRSLLDAVGGFDERMPALEDLDLFLRLARKHPFEHLDATLVRYHDSDGLSRDDQANVRARGQLLVRHWRGIVGHPRFVLQELRWMASTQSRLLRERRARSMGVTT